MSGSGDLSTSTVERPATPEQASQLPIYTTQVHKNSVSALAFFKDGRRVVTGSWDHTVQIWDVEEGALVGGPFRGHHDYVYSVAVSPDDKRIASGGQDRAIIVWDVDGKHKPLRLVRHTGEIWSLCFSFDGKRLASGSHDKRVLIWDAKTGLVVSTLKGSDRPVFRVAFSPDGLKLASGTECKIRVWSIDNSDLLFEINAHNLDGWVHIVWSPDGQQLVSASEDKTIKFWNSSDGTQIGRPYAAHTDDINSLAISPDGSFIATASDDKTVCLWSIKLMGRPLKLAHTALVFCAAFSPGGDLLATGDSSGNLQLWSIENPLSEEFGLDSSYFARRSEVRLDQSLYVEALSDADKVIELDPSSHLGYKLKYGALCGARHYDDASKAFETMLNRLNDSPDPQMQQLYQQYICQKGVQDALDQAIRTQLKDAPLRLINTSTGRVCDRDAQVNAFRESTEYKELLDSSDMRRPGEIELIKEAVAKYFGWVMLSHRWGTKEPLLRDIQDKNIYTLDPVGTMVKLQKFCEVARDAGHHWAWSDTCCIDQNNNFELGESVNSMFIWYRNSVLTIVYLSDVPSKSAALAGSIWNTRGWTVQEFLAPKFVLFYKEDWNLYLDNCSRNHKESDSIMKELERSTGINRQVLANFHPGTTDVLEKLRWASNRDTTKGEDIAYSLFGIFGIHLPVIYGEKRQNALGRLLQYIIAHSGDVSALDWVGQQSSSFNSCLPAEISSYKDLPYMSQSLSEHDIEKLVFALQIDTVAMESALKWYTALKNPDIPRFADARLQLPCITFPLTKVTRRLRRDGAGRFTYDVKADGLQDLPVKTKCDRLLQFPPQQFLLVRPWKRYDLELGGQSGDELVAKGLRLYVRLGQPFGALLLEQQRGGEYKRIASDNEIIAQVGDVASVDNTNVRMLEIL